MSLSTTKKYAGSIWAREPAMGANQWQTICYVVIPIIAPSLIGVALFGFTLSYDKLARTQQAAGSTNTLPLDLQGLTTTVTLAVSFAIIFTTVAIVMHLQRRRSAHGSDAGKGMV